MKFLKQLILLLLALSTCWINAQESRLAAGNTFTLRLAGVPAEDTAQVSSQYTLSSDGTFRVQVPFRDGQQIYPIKAVAADGEQKRNITLEFNRTTPEDNSNPADKAIGEWF